MGPKWGHNRAMAYNLRLPAALDADARERCSRLGISLNALLCVALDAYLRQPDGQAGRAADINPGHTGFEANAVDRSSVAGQSGQSSQPGKLTKSQRREFTSQQREARKP